MNITLYTTHCPKCKVLEIQLQKKGLKFNTIEDEQIMIERGFSTAPILEVDGEVMDYTAAINFIKRIGE